MAIPEKPAVNRKEIGMLRCREDCETARDVVRRLVHQIQTDWNLNTHGSGLRVLDCCQRQQRSGVSYCRSAMHAIGHNTGRNGSLVSNQKLYIRQQLV